MKLEEYKRNLSYIKIEDKIKAVFMLSRFETKVDKKYKQFASYSQTSNSNFKGMESFYYRDF